MSLTYLNFLFAFFSYVETNVIDLLVYLSEASKKRIPSVCMPLVTKSEKQVVNLYSTIRDWVVELCNQPVSELDSQIGIWVDWAKGHQSYGGVCEKTKKVRSYWTALAARIAEVWAEHGIILGSIVVVVAVFSTLRALLAEVWNSSRVQSCVEWIVQSPPAQLVRTIIDIITPWVHQTNDIAGNLATSASGALSGGVEVVSGWIDYVVDSAYYAKFYSWWVSVFDSISDTEAYQKCSEIAKPYVGPAVEKITSCEAYDRLVDKLTPIKEE